MARSMYSEYKNSKFYKDSFDIKSIKTKSHPHHIIPAYNINPLPLSSNGGFFTKLVRSVDSVLSTVPFYFSLIVSIGGLFLLFFIFLHNYEIITNINAGPVKFIGICLWYPKFIKAFLLFYSSVIFYLVILLHSVIKFFIHIFSEIRSKHIYNNVVEKQCLFGIALFILSETMLFFAFFWAFFHSSLTPSIYVGNCWPPVGITTLNPWHIPFLNTCILLTSGITVNWFFFTLKRLSYFSARSGTNVRLEGPLSIILVKSTLYNFLFIDYQLKEFNNSKINKKSAYWNIFKTVYSTKVLITVLLTYANILNLWMVNSLLLLISNSSDKLIFSHKYENVSVQITNLIIKVLLINLLVFKKYIEGSVNSILIFTDKVFFDKLYICKSFEDVFIALILTIYFGVMFLFFQFCEYEFYATFGVDNIYGTVFYSLTLLHGFHVYVGIFSLALCFVFFNSFVFSKADVTKGVFVNFWIIFAVWYWHFVDVVWLFLFIVVYVWGS